MMKKRIFVITIISIAVIFLFWINGIIPAYIAKTSSEQYIEAKYKDRDLKFLKVYWDGSWERYFVSFVDKNDNIYSFKMSQYIPSSIMYDPLDPPG